MARIVRRKRKSNFTKICGIIFSMSLLFWLFVSVFVGTSNVELTIEIQQMKQELSSLKVENQQLNIDIQTLQNKDRVYTIAKDAGLDQNQDNVISVAKGSILEAE